MSHQVDKNDLAYAKERANVVGWIPDVRNKDGKINPHLSQFLTKSGELFSVFHVKPVYYETRQEEWRPLSEVTSYHGNKNIVLNDNWWNIHPRYLEWLNKRQQLFVDGRLLIPSPKGFQYLHKSLHQPVGMTVTPVYPNPSPETTTVDGRIGHYGNGAWSTYRDAATGTEFTDDGANLTSPYAGSPGGLDFYIFRSAFLFDTSVIDDADVVSAATMSYYITGVVDGEADAEGYIAPTTCTPASNTALATADFDQFSYIEQCDSGQRADLTGLSTSAYTDFALNSTGIGNISLTGVSKFAIQEGHDIQDSETTNASSYSGVAGNYAETADVTTDPKLAVTHAAGGSTFIPKVMMY